MKKKKGCHKTMEQKHNDVVDAIAKASVGEGLRTGNFATSEMPLEDVWFSVNGKKVAGNTGQIVREHWARRCAKSYFAEKHILHEEHFDLV